MTSLIDQLAEAVAIGAHVVKFDSVNYANWLGKRADSEAMRSAWVGALKNQAV